MASKRLLRFTENSRTVLLILYGLSIASGFAQEIDWERILDSENSEDQTQLLSYLEFLSANPFDINQVTVNDLMTLPWITPKMARDIIRYRKVHGHFVSTDELENINGVDKELAQIMAHFLIYKKSLRLPHLTLRGRHRISMNLQESRAYTEKKYAGTRDKSLNRLQGGIGKYIHFGLLLEKDAGERAYNDLILGYTDVEIPRLRSELIFGHYMIENAQQLVFGSPYRLGTGYNPFAPFKTKPARIKPYVSTDENAGYLGTAIHGNVGILELYGFVSSTRKDASLVSDSIRSLPNSGLHRTIGEIKNKNSVSEEIKGILLNVRFHEKAIIGLAVQKSQYSHPFGLREGIENRFSFRGRENDVWGINFDIQVKSSSFFGEAARSRSGGCAVMAGYIHGAGPCKWILTFRNYAKNFQNFKASPFGEKETDERGLYLGWQLSLARGLKISAYLNHFKHSWPKYLMPMPGASGMQGLGIIEYTPLKKIELIARIKIKKKETSETYTDSLHNDVKKLLKLSLSSAMAQMEYRGSPDLTLRTRIECNLAQRKTFTSAYQTPQDSTGLLLYEQIRCRLHSSLTIYARWCYFDALSYDNRFYAFENDLPGVLLFKMLYGRGTRWFVLVNYKPITALSLHLKFQHTYYDHDDVIGSGWDQIKSHHDKSISLQLDWRI